MSAEEEGERRKWKKNKWQSQEEERMKDKLQMVLKFFLVHNGFEIWNQSKWVMIIGNLIVEASQF